MSHSLRVSFVLVPLIACGLLIACAPKPQPFGHAESLVTLGKVDSQCRVVTADFSSYVKAGQPVRWLVDNGCTGEQRVEVINILEKGTGTPSFPFVKAPTSCSAPARGHCQIVLVVLPKDPNGGHGNKVYTYDFGLTGKDPELVIEWP